VADADHRGRARPVQEAEHLRPERLHLAGVEQAQLVEAIRRVI
jgi:hypothetical protein